MEQKINIAELLKDCPQGMELDCTMFENLEFDRIEENNKNFPITCRVKIEFDGYNIRTFTKHGCYSTQKYSKCVIFPKNRTTWEGFVPPCKFKDGDIISGSLCTCIFKREGSIKGTVDYYCGVHTEYFVVKDNERYADGHLGDIVDYRLATKEEKERLFQAIKDNGYRWNSETKTLEKLIELKFKVGDRIKHKNYIGRGNVVTEIKDTHYILDDESALPFVFQDECKLVPDKFDINTFVPFDSKVLVRRDMDGFWKPAVFGFYCGRYKNYYVLGGTVWTQCIPYEGNEHLLSTCDDCDDYYKTWE